MSIKDFLESLGKDREFQLQVAGYKYIQPVPARYGELKIKESLRTAFSQNGTGCLYLHQAAAVELIRKRENVVVMTPTSSGKSLAYNIPVLESIMDDPRSTALYLFPLKGLEQDQLKNLNEISALAGMGEVGKVYDGDTAPFARRNIREFLPHVIFTNPDMLHLSIMPFHKKWDEFFRNLKFIVVDEVHSYRGVFGSHVAQVLRRLRRICDFYGSSPIFIAASATIADPSKLAGDLTGLHFDAVRENGAPSAGKHFFFVSPIESPYTVATRLFVQCLRAGIRTIVFTKARKITELISGWTLNYAPELKDKISPYRAGFLPKERREIEAKLFSGELLGVVSTSALELGVDIGGLDCCILCGYPGSVSSTWQRAGRVGRQGEESVVVLIAGQDALDNYFMKHPGEFFERSHEAAVVDAENRIILKKHLACAAAELPLRRDDTAYDIERHMPVIDELAAEEALYPGKGGGIWLSSKKHPHREVAIRAVGERFSVVNEGGRQIGELSGWRVFKEAFPGAIYLHRGRQFRVLELDLTKKRAVCKEVKSQYYTQPLSDGKTEIIEEHGRRKFGRIEFSWGALRMTHRVTGYDRKRIFDRVRISTHDLSLPEYVFETEGVWTVIGNDTKAEIESGGFDLGGTLHAVEHAAIACIPLFALCDRGDIGGLSHTGFPDFGLPAIFVYDGYEGGVGLSKRAAEVPGEWLGTTLKIIEDCPCTGGCPSCVQDAQCGNRNEPLDKEGAKFLLRKWLGE
jgi:DEAD/DEAH box helicase domain-containing protein